MKKSKKNHRPKTACMVIPTPAVIRLNMTFVTIAAFFAAIIRLM